MSHCNCRTPENRALKQQHRDPREQGWPVKSYLWDGAGHSHLQEAPEKAKKKKVNSCALRATQIRKQQRWPREEGEVRPSPFTSLCQGLPVVLSTPDSP